MECLALVDAPDADAVMLDALPRPGHDARRVPADPTTGVDVPLLVVTEEGLTAVNADWGADDVLLDTAGLAEIEARLRLVTGRLAAARDAEPDTQLIRSGDVVIDEASYTAKDGRPDLQGVRAVQVPGAAPRPGVHPGAAAAGGLGVRPTSAAPPPSTCTSGGYAPSSAPSTSS